MGPPGSLHTSLPGYRPPLRMTKLRPRAEQNPLKVTAVLYVDSHRHLGQHLCGGSFQAQDRVHLLCCLQRKMQVGEGVH